MTAPTIDRLAVTGELTIMTAAAEHQRLLGRLTPGGELNLDLTEVTELDTAGLQILLALVHQAHRQGSRLHLVGASPAVTEAFQLVGLTPPPTDPTTDLAGDQ